PAPADGAADQKRHRAVRLRAAEEVGRFRQPPVRFGTRANRRRQIVAVLADLAEHDRRGPTGLPPPPGAPGGSRPAAPRARVRWRGFETTRIAAEIVSRIFPSPGALGPHRDVSTSTSASRACSAPRPSATTPASHAVGVAATLF